MLPGDFTLLQVTPALDAGGVETLTVEMAAAVSEAGARSLVASKGGRLEEELATRGAELIRLPLDARNPVTMAANAVRLEGVIRATFVEACSRPPSGERLHRGFAVDHGRDDLAVLRVLLLTDDHPVPSATGGGRRSSAQGKRPNRHDDWVV